MMGLLIVNQHIHIIIIIIYHNHFSSLSKITIIIIKETTLQVKVHIILTFVKLEILVRSEWMDRWIGGQLVDRIQS